MSEEDQDDESLFDADFLDRLRSMFLMLRERRRLRKSGSQQTPVAGITREFKDHRPYVSGDDYRNIDWKIAARMDKLFIRLFEELQEFHVHIVIDTSRSMVDPYPEKRRIALQSGAALAYLALVNQHTVSLHTLGEEVKRELRPLKGQGTVTQLLDHLARIRFDGMGDLPRALHAFRPSGMGRGIVCLISDFLGEDPFASAPALRQTRLWPAEVYAIQLVAPAERDPELEGDWRLTDVETGRQRRVWLTSRERKAYRELFDRFESGIEEVCLECQIQHLRWDTSHPFEEMLTRLLWQGSQMTS